MRRAPKWGRRVWTIPEQGVRTQELGKEAIYMEKTVGMGCWSLSGVKEVSMCVSRGGGVTATRDLYIQGH